MRCGCGRACVCFVCAQDSIGVLVGEPSHLCFQSCAIVMLVGEVGGVFAFASGFAVLYVCVSCAYGIGSPDLHVPQHARFVETASS